MRYMVEISHRQMRNNSGDVLRRVEAGETILVTNNGRPAAVLSPPSGDLLASLAAKGELRPAIASPSTLRSIKRRPAKKSSAQILADVRGDR